MDWEDGKKSVTNTRVSQEIHKAFISFAAAFYTLQDIEDLKLEKMTTQVEVPERMEKNVCIEITVKKVKKHVHL